MPFQITLKIETLREKVEPDELQGCIYYLIKRGSPEISEKLHTKNKVPLFQGYIINNNFETNLVISILSDEFLIPLMQGWLKQPIEKITFGSQQYAVYSINHNITAWNQFSNLSKNYFAGIKIHFLTLFQVRQQYFIEKDTSIRRILMTPSPELILNLAAKKWNDCFEMNLHQHDKVTAAELTKMLSVITEKSIEGRTYSILSKRGYERGFKGSCSWEYTSETSLIYNKYTQLLKFAEFSGIGSRITRGFGKIELEWLTEKELLNNDKSIPYFNFGIESNGILQPQSFSYPRMWRNGEQRARLERKIYSSKH
ncbi:CRISPR system precrRNA processing endoribonuclease RAMP protein Cas6 [Pigmentibacter sp. JX0631]|uniref:CRISPR system precrRNA processing endoribonuclease RAMP protein Cas6 n=1 Tax=Pigmentibacter sp. JX0631 TaxID=2976982 RepID=UPI0024694E56|nr:CRISPR system precrRNA processing endoribonuclease RAMP protein Cas6 [Pigmentibacter sp. JX0631]WGL60032.1 CRISPR system precrRNA processing endoribonuclease RAMP protein Cas6 [Pigmentibacter sp. JX0631]